MSIIARVIGLTGSCFLTFVLGCTHGATATRGVGESRGEPPVAIFWRNPDYVTPGVPVESGLSVAMWRSGKVVRLSETERGRTYVVGVMSRAQLDDALKAIDVGLRRWNNLGPSADDVPSECAYIQCGGKSKRGTYETARIPDFLATIRRIITTAELSDIHETHSDWQELRQLCE